MNHSIPVRIEGTRSSLAEVVARSQRMAIFELKSYDIKGVTNCMFLRISVSFALDSQRRITNLIFSKGNIKIQVAVRVAGRLVVVQYISHASLSYIIIDIFKVTIYIVIFVCISRVVSYFITIIMIIVSYYSRMKNFVL